MGGKINKDYIKYKRSCNSCKNKPQTLDFSTKPRICGSLTLLPAVGLEPIIFFLQCLHRPLPHAPNLCLF